MGSTGYLSSVSISAAIAVTSAYFGIKLLREGAVKLPQEIGIYAFFLLSLLVHTLVSKGLIFFFWMFLSAGMIWVLIFNIQNTAKKYFFYFLIFEGLLMSSLFVYSRLVGINFLAPDNLFLPAKPEILHNHIGDLWAIILVSLIGLSFKKLNFISTALAAIGLVMMTLSFSRSALVSLAAGTVFVFGKKEQFKKYIPAAVIVISAGLLIYFSFFKSVFSARPYFSEAITALVTRPLGIGVGNFRQVSPETNIVHNIVLEIVSGMGIFSAVFLYWLVSVFRKIYNTYKKGGGGVVFAAIWLAIFFNLFFDSTYVIPGFTWLWFVLLAFV